MTPAPANVKTPAFIVELPHLRHRLEHVAGVCADHELVCSYAVKACSLTPVIAEIGRRLTHFTITSVYEARLVRQACPDATLSATAPGWSDAEIAELLALNVQLFANSATQLIRIAALTPASRPLGIRVNPELSLLDDDRYDPCRSDSRLGVPLSRLAAVIADAPRPPSRLLFHSNCDSDSFAPLLQTSNHLAATLRNQHLSFSQINLGGGYTFDTDELAPLAQAIAALRQTGADELVIEPGAGIIRTACEFRSRVVDLIPRQPMPIAILDTSVHQMPEVFEYQFEPDVSGHQDDHPHWVRLTGASCLAGDVFGEYAFAAPLAPGDLVVFPDAGAYTHVKASPFNGLPLPTVYLRDDHRHYHAIAAYSYQQYCQRNGGPA